MIRNAMFFVSLAAGLPLPAQSITQASPGIMRFNDSAYGVSFLYPDKWTFSQRQPFYMQLSISSPPGTPPPNGLRGVIFTKSVPGVESWPLTSFEGVEIGYDVHHVASADACRALSRTGNNEDGRIGEVTIQSLHFWHSTAANGGLGHGISEDIYSTFVGASAGPAIASISHNLC